MCVRVHAGGGVSNMTANMSAMMQKHILLKTMRHLKHGVRQNDVAFKIPVANICRVHDGLKIPGRRHLAHE